MPAHMSSAIRTDTNPALPVLSRVWFHPCCCLHHCPSVAQHLLLHPSDLPRLLQDRLTGKNGHVLADPLPMDNAFLIHEEEHPPSLPALQAGILNLRTCLPVHGPVGPNGLQVYVAEERVWQPERRRMCLLRKLVVEADPQELHIELLELAVVG